MNPAPPPSLPKKSSLRGYLFPAGGGMLLLGLAALLVRLGDMSPLIPIGLGLAFLTLWLQGKGKITTTEILFFMLPLVLMLFSALTEVPSIYFAVLWLAMLVLVWVARGVQGGWNQTGVRTPYAFLFLPLGGIVIVSVFLNATYKLSIGALAQCLALAPLYWLMAQILASANYRRILLALLLAASLGSLVFIMAFSGNSPRLALAGMMYGIFRAEVLGLNPNTWGMYPLIGLPIAAGLLFYPTGKRLGWLLPALCTPLLLSVALLTLSRSAMLSSAAAITFLLVTHQKLRKYILAIPLAGFALLLILGSKSWILTESILRVGSGLSGRGSIWTICLNIIEEHPFFGLGPGGFRTRFFFHKPFLPNGLDFTLDPPSTHNAFLNLAVELGIPAMLVALLIFLLFFHRALPLWKRLKGQPDFAVQAICCAMMVGGLVRALFEVDFILPHGFFYENLVLMTLLAIQDLFYHREYGSA